MGPQGPAGADGAVGPAGPQGPTGLSGHTAAVVLGSSYFNVATGNNAITYVGIGESNGTENKVAIASPLGGTVSGFRVRSNVAPDNGGGTQAYTVTLRLNNASTTLTCTLSETTTSCSDTVNTAAITAGNAMAVMVQESGSGTPIAVSVTWSLTISE